MKVIERWGSVCLSVALLTAVGSLVVAPHSGVAGTETNFGVLSVGQSLEHRILVENKGIDVLTITNVVSSCECLHILSYPRQVAPASTGEIAVKVVAEKAGAFRYEVAVETTDRASPRRSFFLNVSAVAPTATGSSGTGDYARQIQWPVRVVQPREQSLYLPVEEVLAKMANGEDLAFADVREKRAYEAGHIRGAINLALHAVKSGGFLRNRTVVLVDEGWGNPVLESECHRLMEMGFPVRILRGGMNAWQTAEAALQPGGAAAPALAEVQARDYLTGRKFEDWLVVDARLQGEAAGSRIPEAVNIPFLSAPKNEFAENVAGLVVQRNAYTRVLIVGMDGMENERIRHALPTTNGRCSVFFLAGGYQALREQLAVGRAMTQSRTVRNGAQTRTSNGQEIRKPCGGCP